MWRAFKKDPGWRARERLEKMDSLRWNPIGILSEDQQVESESQRFKGSEYVGK